MCECKHTQIGARISVVLRVAHLPTKVSAIMGSFVEITLITLLLAFLAILLCGFSVAIWPTC